MEKYPVQALKIYEHWNVWINNNMRQTFFTLFYAYVSEYVEEDTNNIVYARIIKLISVAFI